MSKIHVYEAVAKALIDHEVDVMFGLVGDANLFLVNDYASKQGGEFVAAVHEGGSVLMALAYAQMSDKVGVATVTHGPALTNCVTALVECARAQVPLVLIAGDTPSENAHHLQGIDQHEVAKAAECDFVQVRTPASACFDLATAFNRALTKRRPVVLNLPANFVWEKVDYEKVICPQVLPQAVAPDGENFENAVGMIASAKRPLILAGGGARGAAQSLAKLSDRLEAPIATTLNARGLFGEHPFCIDICGTLSTPAGYEAIDNADCIVSFGAGLNDFTTDRGKLFNGKRVVQIDHRKEAIGRFLFPDAAVVGDADLAAEKIIELFDIAEIPPSGFTKELDQTSLRHHPKPAPNTRKQGTVSFVDALDALNDHLPRNRILVTDGGRFMTEVWCRISVEDEHSYLDTVHFGSIGLGLQEAIGVSIAKPDKPVVLFTGDGGFMMGGLAELNTAVRLGLNLTVIVCNDAAYGAEHIQLIDRQMDPKISEFEWPDFCTVATSLGCRGVSVRTDSELDTALEAIQNPSGVTLIDLHLDPNDMPRMRI